jgi:hypothetical protein
MKKDEVTIIILCFFVFVIGFLAGSAIGYNMGKPKHPLRISVVAVQEIMQECSGNFRDLVANRQYVYANCVTPNGPKPVTIQNYRMK